VGTYAGKIGTIDGTLSNARFNSPRGLVMDSLGAMYVTTTGDDYSIRVMSTAGYVTTIAGSPSSANGLPNGFGTNSRFGKPAGLAATSSGRLFIPDYRYNNVRIVDKTGNGIGI
jgi:S-formylglutathione hydrolase FrmB